MNVLKMVTPVTAARLKYGICFFKIFQSFIKLFHAMGNRKTVATLHLKKANDTGEIRWCKARATIKFPDHKIVASKANPKPFTKSFLRATISILQINLSFC